MANPEQQGLKLLIGSGGGAELKPAEMANPEQQGLKHKISNRLLN